MRTLAVTSLHKQSTRFIQIWMLANKYRMLDAEFYGGCWMPSNEDLYLSQPEVAGKVASGNEKIAEIV